MTPRLPLLLVLVASFCSACLGTTDGPAPGTLLAPTDDPPQATVGERLFLETRFAQFFATHASTLNSQLMQGDQVLDTTVTTGAALPGPFLGQSMNCAACHLVDQQFLVQGGGMRTYGDFARRSPIPLRSDGKELTPRNSPPLVQASVPGPQGVLLHFDSQFASTEELVSATLTGRNYGWLPSEHDAAVAHIAAVVRADNGMGTLAADYENIPYRTLLAPPPQVVPAQLYLPASYRIDVATASDAQILAAVARLIAAYVDNLRFQAVPATGEFSGSPYDAFLKANDLPRKPDPGETPLAYSRRLRDLLALLNAPVWVDADAHGHAFQTHDQQFEFGQTELDGLRMFLREPASMPPSAQEIAAGGIGNCLACHAAPRFTDVLFHNTGASQEEYDQVHATGAFLNLYVPDLPERDANFDLWLPATPAHPNALGPLLAIPAAGDDALADLGLWNVFANPDEPSPQAALRALLCNEFGLDPATTTNEQLLPSTLAYFKTPGLRDLGHSNPYMHNGSFDSIELVLEHYRTFSALARSGLVRNASPELAGVALLPADSSALSAFLRSLNEDYQ
jgi:Di-haem cytochrome c peroxidase